MDDYEYLERAVKMAVDNQNGDAPGGPFAALIVKGNDIVGEGTNRVTPNNDPTAHAEVMAIRNACERLGTFDLKGCVMYASCEPCPMCLGAIYWAHIGKVYFAAGQKDAAEAGFDDSHIYREVNRCMEERSIWMQALRVRDRLAPFRVWSENENKTKY